ncbi:MAG TPA: type VI secretion system baseplate subunit TssE [Planctomycetaceae bacterium]|nr:type VI secretion system baseplate subunit TssE [Planctomycetaceae bacterium]|tara:strand:+ start:29047 stop:29541 length:495 start_codon:yes stop_codon:yes gene_type:complete
MARVRADQPLTPSILDRLIDEEPGNPRDPPKSRHQVLRELKQSVRRDLENLLNTRWRCVAWPPNLDQLDVSVVNYGIPDFSGASMSAANDRSQLCSMIERIIRQYDPRFKSVKVTLLENQDGIDRTMRFRIDALLHADPEPEPVVFDSQLEPTFASVEIKAPGR